VIYLVLNSKNYKYEELCLGMEKRVVCEIFPRRIDPLYGNIGSGPVCYLFKRISVEDESELPRCLAELYERVKEVWSNHYVGLPRVS
jgi:hypothetical protein